MFEMTTKDLIDLTSMRHICASLLNDPAITAIVNVKDLDLAEIGDIMIETEKEKSEEQIAKYNHLLQSRQLEVYFTVEEVPIPLLNCVDCIRLEPFYIIKDLKKLYR